MSGKSSRNEPFLDYEPSNMLFGFLQFSEINFKK